MFSHDGKRLAYVDATPDPTGKTAVIVDGRTDTRGHAFMLPTFTLPTFMRSGVRRRAGYRSRAHRSAE